MAEEVGSTRESLAYNPGRETVHADPKTGEPEVFLEPLLWGLFSLGGFITAFLFPITVFLLFLAPVFAYGRPIPRLTSRSRPTGGSPWSDCFSSPSSGDHFFTERLGWSSFSSTLGWRGLASMPAAASSWTAAGSGGRPGGVSNAGAAGL